MTTQTTTQFYIFQDCIARRVLAHLSLRARADSSPDSDLDDFSSYLALESWSSLPEYLHIATYTMRPSVPTDVDKIPLEATSVSFIDTLIAYRFASDHDEALQFLRRAVGEYISEVYAAPPPWSSTRTQECEICEREVPLTYHHLIPRSTHAKVLKKKWHPEEMLNSVAWLCRPCHSVVHSVAANEELAKEYFTVDRLLARDDVTRWKKYAAKQKFGIRRA